MAAHVGEEYGRSLASRMTPSEGQRTVRAAMHVVAETLTAHGFAAHAEDRGETTAVDRRAVPLRRRQQHEPGAVRSRPRAWSRGCWRGLCGTASQQALPVILSSRARGDDACTASA